MIVDLDQRVAVADRVVDDLEQDVRVHLPAGLAGGHVLVRDERDRVDEEDGVPGGAGGAGVEEGEVLARSGEEVLVHLGVDRFGDAEHGHLIRLREPLLDAEQEGEEIVAALDLGVRLPLLGVLEVPGKLPPA